MNQSPVRAIPAKLVKINLAPGIEHNPFPDQ